MRRVKETATAVKGGKEKEKIRLLGYFWGMGGPQRSFPVTVHPTPLSLPSVLLGPFPSVVCKVKLSTACSCSFSPSPPDVLNYSPHRPHHGSLQGWILTALKFWLAAVAVSIPAQNQTPEFSAPCYQSSNNYQPSLRVRTRAEKS